MGSHLATMLSGNGHDITVIDRDAKALEEVGTLADIITVEGTRPPSRRCARPRHASAISSSR